MAKTMDVTGTPGAGQSLSVMGPVARPTAAGLYDPAREHDACGVGFIVDIQGRRSHRILEQAI